MYKNKFFVNYTVIYVNQSEAENVSTRVLTKDVRASEGIIPMEGAHLLLHNCGKCWYTSRISDYLWSLLIGETI